MQIGLSTGLTRLGKPEGVAGSLSFVTSTNAVFGGSPSVVTAPSGIRAGDALIAFVFTRSAIIPPTGWTVLDSVYLGSSANQVLYVCKKDLVTDGDSGASFTWSQAVPQSLGVCYQVVRSSTGLVLYGTVAKTSLASGTAISNPVISASGDAQIVVSGVSATTVPSPMTISAPVGMVLSTNSASLSNNRLGAAWQTLNDGASTAGSWTFSGTCGDIGSISVILRAA